MDEKTLKDKLRELVEDIMGETYCYYCRGGDGINYGVYDDSVIVEAILKLFFEFTQE